eukprot:11642-Heterococcus_DN1.PRE.1
MPCMQLAMNVPLGSPKMSVVRPCKCAAIACSCTVLMPTASFRLRCLMFPQWSVSLSITLSHRRIGGSFSCCTSL